MAPLKKRLEIMTRLGDYLLSDDPDWNSCKQEAFHYNKWFIPEFIQFSIQNIATNFLKMDLMEAWVSGYPGMNIPKTAKTIGLVAAGNI
ncbi:MAG: acyl-CoA reductase, partial [Chitinophagaceae bacterium]